MTFSYSHLPKTGWRGEFPSASTALLSGRAAFGNDTRVFVAQWSEGHYSDIFIGAATLLAYMREDAAGKVDDAYLDAFDGISPDSVADLDERITEVVGGWEADLPPEAQFGGRWVKRVRGYSPEEQVRPGHWS